MNFDAWVERNRHLLGSEYEILFSTQVLPLVEGLQCDAVTAQYHFVDSDGKNRYSDFAIIESQAVRIAIEIDGYDKRGTGTGMSREDFLDWQRRQASLASQGWHVLRFANRDVRDEPRRCAEHITQLLTRLRQAQAGHIEIVTIQPQPAEKNLVPLKVLNARQSKLTTKKIYKLLPWIIVALLVGIVVWQKSNDVPSEKTSHATVATSPTNADSVPSEYLSTFPTKAQAAAATTSTSITSPSSAGQSRNASGIEEFSYGKLDCVNPLDWSAAKQHIGQVVKVVGPLLASKPRPDIPGSPLWLDVGGIYPNQDRLTVVVWGKNWSKFNMQDLDAEYWFATVFDELEPALICIEGRVTEYKGVPQIELQDSRQVLIGSHPKYR